VIDRRMIALELLDRSDQILEKNEFMIIFRVWDPSTFKLGPRHEVIVKSNNTNSELAEKIFQLDSSVAVPNMMFQKICAIWNFNLSSLLDDSLVMISLLKFFCNLFGKLNYEILIFPLSLYDIQYEAFILVLLLTFAKGPFFTKLGLLLIKFQILFIYNNDPLVERTR
jgi:hypothetical protein